VEEKKDSKVEETCHSNLDAVQDEMSEQAEDVKEQVEQDQGNQENEEQRFKEYENLLKVLQADFDNYKKRTQREREEIYSYANIGFAKDILPILDNLERALASINKEDPAQKAIFSGVEMIYNQFISALEKNNVTEIDALLQPFNPEKHYGVMQVEDSDQPENTIVEVLQKGYTLKDKVIRPSMVKVSK
jgi:molecular chaperone GrpE